MSDGQLLRRQNLAMVLRDLRESGPRSRARIADDTGLNKATVSSLVAELVALGLVREGRVERGGVGRPGLSVEIDGRVCGLGAEIAAGHIAVLVLDLRGEEVLRTQTALDVTALGTERTLDELAAAVTAAIARARERGRDVAGITVAVPGMVETAPGIVRHSPGLGWRDVPVAAGLAARLAAPGVPVRAADAAALGALAEYTAGSCAGVPDLVHVTGDSCLGGGVITGGTLLRGAEGYGGQIGHLPIGDPAHRCGCGQRGCWETSIGPAALLREVADPDDDLTNPALDPRTRLSEIRRRAALSDARTLRGLHAIGTSLGLGAAILINLFDPRVITLGGYFAVLGDLLLPAMEAELDRRAVLPARGGCRVELSTLGFTAACRGGAHAALEAVLTDPTSVPSQLSGGAA
ncbi:ROK family transcriptional regulator [Streptomyces sp. 7-21]|uniref:ROK family transcriptional regulator n=1 Tax=Streptomyces sp. 7-21 TaxID=2802283 RepID=UPI00191F5AA3|nr:ROK family transcriptional regulator [Streptomyces sp. 7-21]MBL1067793.1 ROK family transcriptional regulator [Streptomyces sp. 7-21]